MAGLLQPDRGELSIDGYSLAQLTPGKQLSRLVGLVHQQYDLVPHLPVVHNVLAGRLGQWSLLRSLASLVWPQRQIPLISSIPTSKHFRITILIL